MSVPFDYPESRTETYLANICCNSDYPIPTDEISRLELYLKYILEHGTAREQAMVLELAKKAYYYKGYKYNGEFYSDVSHTTLIPHSLVGLYIDVENDSMYYWTGSTYEALTPLVSGGKFLSYWQCEEGLAYSFPATIPYSYTTGDFYIVRSVGTTNYRPNGSAYNSEVSTTVETNLVSVNDYYFYDGIRWLLLKNTWPQLSNYLAKNNTVEFTPSGNYNPATKKYVDDSISTELTNYVQKTDMATATNAGLIKIGPRVSGQSYASGVFTYVAEV